MITLRLEPRNSFVGWNHMAFTNQASEKWVTNKNFRKFKFVVWKMSNFVFQIFWGLCIKWFLRILRPRSLAEPSPSVSIWLATLSTVFATGRLNNNRYILKKFTLVPNDVFFFFFFKSLLDCYSRICLSCTKSIRMLIAQIDRFQWLWRLWTGDGEHVWLFSRACVLAYSLDIHTDNTYPGHSLSVISTFHLNCKSNLNSRFEFSSVSVLALCCWF